MEQGWGCKQSTGSLCCLPGRSWRPTAQGQTEGSYLYSYKQFQSICLPRICFDTVFRACSELLCRFVAMQGSWLCTHPHVVPVPRLGASGTGVFQGQMSILSAVPSSWEHLWSCGSAGRGWLCVGGV